MTPKELDVIRGITEKLYFCLRQYQREENTYIVDREAGLSIKSNIGQNQVSPFEAMLALISFNKSNPYLFVQEKQISQSKTPRVVNWKRTMSSSTPIEIVGNPIYLEIIGRRLDTKRDDPLLIVYYSLLNEFRQYDPSILIDTSVDLIRPARLDRLKSKISMFLRTSRSLYFSDKFRQLHSLLRAYYFAERASYNNQHIEFLFTDDFDRVFERLVDSIISDEYLLHLYKQLKDGKEIDHLFGEKDVFQGNKIIYIGDSKYYKDPSKIATQRHKQFTYARNIIQENIYIINSGQTTTYSRNYRDEVSEGYNITPNFFMLGSVSKNYLEGTSLIEPDKQAPEYSFHFPNRLFDRDTLHVLYFRADFLRMLNFYVGKGKRLSLSRQVERERARSIIQNELMSYLNARYDFYKLGLTNDFIDNHFRVLHGKVFASPSTYPAYILALEKMYPHDNSTLMSFLVQNSIDIQKFQLADPNCL